MALLIGPVVALLGVFTVYFLIRTRARARASLYARRRAELEQKAMDRRARALAPASATHAQAAVAGQSWDSMPAHAPAAAATGAMTPGAPVAHSTAVGPAEPAWSVADPNPGMPGPARPGRLASGKHRPGEEGEEEVRETFAQTVLSYVGLVAALVVVLLGVLLMVANSKG